jgi:hypothetical protein
MDTMEHAEIPLVKRVVKGGGKRAPAPGEMPQENGPIIGSVALPLTHALGRAIPIAIARNSNAQGHQSARAGVQGQGTWTSGGKDRGSSPRR